MGLIPAALPLQTLIVAHPRSGIIRSSQLPGLSFSVYSRGIYSLCHRELLKSRARHGKHHAEQPPPASPWFGGRRGCTLLSERGRWVGWWRRLFHRQLWGGMRGALPSAALAAQRGLCLEQSCAAIDELLLPVGGRGEAWREEDGRQSFWGPRETLKGPSSQGKGLSTNTALQIFMLREKK